MNVYGGMIKKSEEGTETNDEITFGKVCVEAVVREQFREDHWAKSMIVRRVFIQQMPLENN